MRDIVLLLACLLTLAACATPEETAALNAGMYNQCVSESTRLGSDPVTQCGPSATTFKPSFSDRYKYFQAQYQAQQQGYAQQAVQRPSNPCDVAYFAELGRPTRGGYGEAQANAERARLVCMGVPVPPAPAAPKTTYCERDGINGVVCTTQ